MSVRAAIESALSGMTPMLAAATISSSSIAAASVITTAAAHGLVTGANVLIAGHTGSTPTINGVQKVTVISTTKFSIPVAVTTGGTGGTATALLSAWENVDFAPVIGLPYQTGSLILAKPDNTEYGPNYIEQGIYQIDLAYPSQVGTKDCEARAALIRTTFKRGYTFTSGGIIVSVMGTPWIMKGYPAPGTWVIPVRIPFQAQITA